MSYQALLGRPGSTSVCPPTRILPNIPGQIRVEARKLEHDHPPTPNNEGRRAQLTYTLRPSEAYCKKKRLKDSWFTCSSYNTPVFACPILGLGSCNRKVGHQIKGMSLQVGPRLEGFRLAEEGVSQNPGHLIKDPLFEKTPK